MLNSRRVVHDGVIVVRSMPTHVRVCRAQVVHQRLGVRVVDGQIGEELRVREEGKVVDILVSELGEASA
jgi:hypothetical protein